MADTYEKDLAQKSSLTVNDFIRVVGTDNVSYKQLVSDVAKKIIENYTGSSLAGSSQSVKSALDALNSKTTKTIESSSPSGTFRVNTHAGNSSQFLVLTYGEVYTVFIDWANNVIAQAIIGRASTSRGVTFSISDASTHTVGYTATANLWGGLAIIGN